MMDSLLWGDFNQLVEFELLGLHGVHIDRHESADLLEDVVLVDKRIAYVEAAEVGADCVHDESSLGCVRHGVSRIDRKWNSGQPSPTGRAGKTIKPLPEQPWQQRQTRTTRSAPWLLRAPHG
jgi:hypothetical protein